MRYSLEKYPDYNNTSGEFDYFLCGLRLLKNRKRFAVGDVYYAHEEEQICLSENIDMRDVVDRAIEDFGIEDCYWYDYFSDVKMYKLNTMLAEFIEAHGRDNGEITMIANSEARTFTESDIRKIYNKD